VKLFADKLAAALQRELLPAYLIAGDEPLLIQEAGDAVRAAARAAEFGDRELMHCDASFNWDSLYHEASAMSLFANRKIIELRLSTKPSDKGEAISEFLARCDPDQLLLVIYPGKLDKPLQNSRWVKAIDDVGAVVQAPAVGAAQLPRFIQQRLKLAGVAVNEEAAALLGERVEGNLLAAVQEIEKLKLLAVDGHIDAQTLSNVVADSARYNTWEFIDRMLAGDTQAVARSLRGMRAEGGELLPLLWAIGRDLRALARAAELTERGLGSETALQKVGVWSSRMAPMKRALQRSRAAQLRMYIHQLAAIDRAAKGIRASDGWQELTSLALAIAGAPLLSPATIKLEIS